MNGDKTIGWLCEIDNIVVYELMLLEEYFKINLGDEFTAWIGRKEINLHRTFAFLGIEDSESIFIEEKR